MPLRVISVIFGTGILSDTVALCPVDPAGCFIADFIQAYKIPKSRLPYLEPPFAHFRVLLPHGVEQAAHQIVKERLQPLSGQNRAHAGRGSPQ
jgi:hypothetical protein